MKVREFSHGTLILASGAVVLRSASGTSGTVMRKTGQEFVAAALERHDIENIQKSESAVSAMLQSKI
jgi:hypothetical protein